MNRSNTCGRKPIRGSDRSGARTRFEPQAPCAPTRDLGLANYLRNIRICARGGTVDLQPYIAHMLHCFGPARMLFGSDWPVVELAGTYERWVAAAVEATSHLSPALRDDIFINNAARVYRLV